MEILCDVDDKEFTLSKVVLGKYQTKDSIQCIAKGSEGLTVNPFFGFLLGG
jgi:hypothetical protein